MAKITIAVIGWIRLHLTLPTIMETVEAEFAIGPLLFVADLAYAILAIVWMARALRGTTSRPPVAPWSRPNMVLLAAAIALFPLIYLLLVSGPQHGTSDQIGVLLTFVQWCLLNAAMAPAA